MTPTSLTAADYAELIANAVERGDTARVQRLASSLAEAVAEPASTPTPEGEQPAAPTPSATERLDALTVDQMATLIEQNPTAYAALIEAAANEDPA